MGIPNPPYQPYASVHINPQGPGDARPTTQQVLEDCNALGNLSGKSIFVTGASSFEPGFATAAALYETGARFFLTALDTAELERVIEKIVTKSSSNGSPRPEPVQMDLSSFSSIKRAAAYIPSKTKDLDVLIGNAAVMYVPFQRTEDGFETDLAVNHLSHFLLFQELKPLMIQGAKNSCNLSRMVLVSSAEHCRFETWLDDWNFERSEYNLIFAYEQSKTANIYMANTLARLYAEKGITALSLYPGTILETDIWRLMPEEALGSLRDNNTDFRQTKSVDQGVATTVWAAVSPYFDEVTHGSRYLADVGECAPIDGDQFAYGASGCTDHTYDEVKADRLWDFSCEAVGLPCARNDLD